MRYYIIAGEASGDLHGSNLILELHKLDPQLQVRCWGGDKMQAAGGELVKHYRDLAFMGFTEVLKNLPVILKNLRFCKEDIVSFKPDALILIDYPGFNLRIAKWAKQQGIRVVFYISPQVWAWKENRVKNIKASVEKMIVILPFEKEFYQKWSYEVDYVGHPLVQVVQDFRSSNNISQADFPLPAKSPITSYKGIIALLPGSRKQEIQKKLPIMLALTKHFPSYHFIVAKSPGIDISFYDSLLTDYPNVSTVTDRTYAILSVARAALVTSGTATLETALFHVPQIICYKGNSVSYEIAKRLINIKFIGLVNLIMNKEVVRELIQHELTVENLKKELTGLLEDETKRAAIEKEYSELETLLGKGGKASANAARLIHDLVATN